MDQSHGEIPQMGRDGQGLGPVRTRFAAVGSGMDGSSDQSESELPQRGVRQKSAASVRRKARKLEVKKGA